MGAGVAGHARPHHQRQDDYRLQCSLAAHPGAGLSLLPRDLVLERGLEQLLYVTYTSRLKRAAREFLGAQAPELAQRVHIRTLAELEKELTGLPALSDPLSDLADFRRYLELQPSASL
ncbi:MAG: hypothetical protein NTV69_18545, partial [Caldilinea sp.]|nr:hypothetical protein [Caldilinea sp.]